MYNVALQDGGRRLTRRGNADAMGTLKAHEGCK